LRSTPPAVVTDEEKRVVPPFRERLNDLNPEFCTFDTLRTLQINLGNLCNLSCTHCHVAASPAGKKVMGREVMEAVAGCLARVPDLTLDITGGCPEMNPLFRSLIESTSGLSPRRILRSNLVIMDEPGKAWLPSFCREQELVITASLPCYLEENVDRQRGNGAYATSIRILRKLNSCGYGDDRELNLVYNPGGEYLPGSQLALEAAYRAELEKRHGIRFTRLLAMANAPLGRFRGQLQASGSYDSYLRLLANRFNPSAATGIMCRTLISVDWRGMLYNCDFNQAAGLPITGEDGVPLHISSLAGSSLVGSDLLLGQHCYSCTAGEGSSCTGVLA
jgi:radical SAM/Cys-rich protein